MDTLPLHTQSLWPLPNHCAQLADSCKSTALFLYQFFLHIHRVFHSIVTVPKVTLCCCYCCRLPISLTMPLSDLVGEEIVHNPANLSRPLGHHSPWFLTLFKQSADVAQRGLMECIIQNTHIHTHTHTYGVHTEDLLQDCYIEIQIFMHIFYAGEKTLVIWWHC